jgi:hypothetical protein
VGAPAGTPDGHELVAHQITESPAPTWNTAGEEVEEAVGDELRRRRADLDHVAVLHVDVRLLAARDGLQVDVEDLPIAARLGPEEPRRAHVGRKHRASPPRRRPTASRGRARSCSSPASSTQPWMKTLPASGIMMTSPGRTGSDITTSDIAGVHVAQVEDDRIDVPEERLEVDRRRRCVAGSAVPGSG